MWNKAYLKPGRGSWGFCRLILLCPILIMKHSLLSYKIGFPFISNGTQLWAINHSHPNTQKTATYSGFRVSSNQVLLPALLLGSSDIYPGYFRASVCPPWATFPSPAKISPTFDTQLTYIEMLLSGLWIVCACENICLSVIYTWV